MAVRPPGREEMNKYKVTWDERLGEALVDEHIKLGLETAGAVITRISKIGRASCRERV